MRLPEIAEEMLRLADRASGDPETDHVRADELLIETIRYLAEAGGLTSLSRDLTTEILTAYETVGKWYA